MSWKGFTKAITRLPQIVLQKAGAAEETKDGDFVILVQKFEKAAGVTERMHEDLRKYRDSVKGMLLHQTGLIEAFKMVLEHEEGGRTAQHPHLLEAILDQLKTAKAELLDELEHAFTNRALKILDEVLAAQRNLSTKITKRSHKLLDYDRHRHSIKKLEEISNRSISDERKLLKTQQALTEAEVEYSKYNQRLKEDLPVFLTLHARLMQPVLEGLIRFQQRLYHTQRSALAKVATLGTTGYAAILREHEQSISEAIALLYNIPMLQAVVGRGKKPNATDSGRSTPISPNEIPTRPVQAKVDEENPVAKVKGQLPQDSLPITNRPISIAKDLQKEVEDEIVTQKTYIEIYPSVSKNVKTANFSKRGKEPTESVPLSSTRPQGSRVAELASKLGALNPFPEERTPSSESRKTNPPKTRFEGFSEEKLQVTKDQSGRENSSKFNFESQPFGKVGPLRVPEPNRSVPGSTNSKDLPIKGSPPISSQSPPPLPPKKSIVLAMYDFKGQEKGDLSFQAGDNIEVIKRTSHREDWWTGQLAGRTGMFPGNYTVDL